MVQWKYQWQCECEIDILMQARGWYSYALFARLYRNTIAYVLRKVF